MAVNAERGRSVLGRSGGTVARLSTETKASFKTTEFFAFLAAVAGVLIAAGVVDEANAGGFGAKQAWLYVSILGAGYFVSRGLAKSGSYEPDRDYNPLDLTDRDSGRSGDSGVAGDTGRTGV